MLLPEAIGCWISSTSLSTKSMTSTSGDIRRRWVGRSSSHKSTSMTSTDSRRRRCGITTSGVGAVAVDREVDIEGQVVVTV